jgi:hypothetical protein
MTATRALAIELAAGGDSDSLGQTLMGFLLRHLTDSFKRTHLANTKPVGYAIRSRWSIGKPRILQKISKPEVIEGQAL